MEFVGEENRIQALFHELRLEDEQVTPRFSAVLNRAQSSATHPASGFRVALVTASVLLVCTVLSVAWWSRYRQERQTKVEVTGVRAVPGVAPALEAVKSKANDIGTAQQRHRAVSKPRFVKFAARRQAELLAESRGIADAAAISSWQSPTEALLRSAADEVLTSLPELDASSNELKSFLPSRPN
jgi:hypothetical protein